MIHTVRKAMAALGADGGMVFRYLATSAVNVVNHQILLQLAVRWWGWGGGAANAFAASIAVIPAYLLSRYWVWEVTGSHSLRREVVPFWTIAALGLVLSTAAAELADRAFGSALIISVASLAAYLVVWVLKFVVLSLLFRAPDAETKITAAESALAGGAMTHAGSAITEAGGAMTHAGSAMTEAAKTPKV